MMAAVDLKVQRQNKGNKVSALIKVFECNHDDLAPKRRQKNTIVSDCGRYAPRADVTGTWTPIKSCGDGWRGKKKVETTRRKIVPRPGFVKELIARFGGLDAA